MLYNCIPADTQSALRVMAEPSSSCLLVLTWYLGCSWCVIVFISISRHCGAWGFSCFKEENGGVGRMIGGFCFRIHLNECLLVSYPPQIPALPGYWGTSTSYTCLTLVSGSSSQS